jgi:septal ring factor EnvC (AmiA/AmiB activator)
MPAAGATARLPLPFLALLALLWLPVHATADDEVTRADLQRAQQRVAEIQKQVESSRQALSAGQQRLRKAERELGDIAVTLRQMTLRERELARTLARVQAERSALAARIGKQKAALARDARQAWMLGREQQLRLWLNADDPQAVARISRYYAYVERDRAQRLDAFRSVSEELAALEQRVAGEQAQLDQARNELAVRERQLAEARKERKQAVAALASELRSQKEELASRKADAAALGRLFSQVREAFRHVPPPKRTAQPVPGRSEPAGNAPEAVAAPFKQRKGKLRWPVAGRLAAKFGSAIAEGKLTLNGVVIAASEGSEVRAVHEGRVVYADWLRGYGQLLIVDHGTGYLSAYGYNQSLLRGVGDWVREGEALATVGSSGGHGQPGLYFELRLGGEPQDPARWLR